MESDETNLTNTYGETKLEYLDYRRCMEMA